jgi:hypothetical protein
MVADAGVARASKSANGEPLPESGQSLLGKAAVLIWNDVAHEGLRPFYEWHDKEHIPERLSLPGFRRGRRLRSRNHSPEWLTIYEATDLSALVSPEYLARLNSPTPATTATLKYFRSTSRAVCQVVTSLGGSSGGYVLAMRLSVDPPRIDAMSRYLQKELFPRALEIAGAVACHLFAADAKASYVNTAESSTRTFDVPEWVLLFEASSPEAAAALKILCEQASLPDLGVTIRPDAAIYTLEISRLGESAAKRSPDLEDKF